MLTRAKVLAAIDAERERQLEIWGDQHRNSAVWGLILFEEVGEFAQAALEGRTDDAMEEVLQVAAICVAMLEDHAHRGVKQCTCDTGTPVTPKEVQ